MTLPESTEQASSTVTTLRRFCLAVIEHDRTDQQRYLSEAMRLRIELLKSGDFTSEYLDGLRDGISHSLNGGWS